MNEVQAPVHRDARLKFDRPGWGSITTCGVNARGQIALGGSIVTCSGGARGQIALGGVQETDWEKLVLYVAET